MSFRRGDSRLPEGGCKSARFGQRITVLSDGTITLQPVLSEGGVPSVMRQMRAVQIEGKRDREVIEPTPAEVPRHDDEGPSVVLQMAARFPDMLSNIVPGGELTMETLKMLGLMKQVSKVVSQPLKGNLTEVTSVNVVQPDGLIQVLFKILPDLPSLTSITINTRLTEEQFQTIAGAIPSLSKLQVLNLAETNMAEAGAQAIAGALQGTPELQKLDLSYNEGIGEAGIQAIADAIPKLTQLQFLSLGSTDMAEAGAQAIANALTPSLQQLDLSGNYWIREDGFQAIADAIKKCKGLEKLNLSSTGMEAAGAKAIANALAQEKPPLQQLDLSWNRSIGEAGFQAIAEAIRSLNKLSVLNLAYINMQTAGAEAIANTLTPSLQHLDLSGNKLIGVDGFQAIAKAISTLTQLRVLNLANTGMKTAAAQAIAKALLGTPGLQELNLYRNRRVGVDGFQAIAEAISTLTQLRVLNLAYINMQTAGARAIAKALLETPGLQELDLSYNKKIGVDGFQAITQAIRSLNKLRVLRLRFTEMQAAGARAIANALAEQKELPLRELDLSGNKLIGEDGLKAIEDATLKLTNFKTLKLT